ncbi:MAG TPA: energy transducer TonB, partial [Candidatus Nanopelagicales bacterium]|nr:energy transducer TonB [Candidatus Nanopelagicales bacterium]
MKPPAPQPSRSLAPILRIGPRGAAALALLALASPWTSPALAQQGSGQQQQQQPSGGDSGVPRGAAGAIPTPPQPDAAPAQPGQPTPPRATNYAPPEYPPEAKAEGREGKVTLQLDIDRTGKVLQAVVVEPAGFGFDEAAVAAAKKLDFEPARRADGTAIAARILYRYTFTLQPEQPAPGPDQPGGQGDAP